MSSAILICDSCGKQYKPLPGAEKALVDGKALCPVCWAESELERELEKVAENLTKTGQIALAVPASKDHRCSEFEAQIEDLKTRLKVAEEQKASALEEREYSYESRLKLEKTLAEFLTRFAATRESEVAAVKERDRVRRELEEVITGLRKDLAKSTDEAAKAVASCEKATQARAELERRVNEFMNLLATERHAHAEAMRGQTDVLKDRDAKSDSSRVLEDRISELSSKLEAAHQSEKAAKEECDATVEIHREMETKIAQLRTQATAAKEGLDAACRERDAAKTRQIELELEVAELKEWMVTAQDAQKAAIRDRESALSDLNRFREMALASLEPLGIDCNRDMKELMGETEGVLNEARRVRDEAAQRMEKIERLASDLRAHINAVRRQMSQRVSQVLGTPASMSGLHASVAAMPAVVVPEENATPPPASKEPPLPKPPSSAVLAGVSSERASGT